MELIQAIKERRSICRFKAEPVPRALLEKIIKEAMWAPSAMNTQPWKFFVLTGAPKDRLIAITGRSLAKLDIRLKALFKENMITLVHSYFKDYGGAPPSLSSSPKNRKPKAIW